MMDASLESYAVLDTFTDLLIVAIHQILHNRNIYPLTLLPPLRNIVPLCNRVGTSASADTSIT
jgi:hypothetical protein